jgi:hypothetical protein
MFAVAAVTLIIYSNTGLHLEAVAGPGMLGEKTITAGQSILNEFTTVTEDVKAGSTQINVDDNILNSHGRFAGNLQSGELVMIVQMQNGPKAYVNLDENGNIDNAGKYEFAEVAGVEEGPKINFTAALKNSYQVNGKTQVVRVPRFHSLTIEKAATITTDSWDGKTGGIAAIEVKGNAVINGTIDVTGKGFNEKAFQKLLKSAADARKVMISSDTSGSRIFLGSASINKTLNSQCNGGGIVFLVITGTVEGNGAIHADGSNVKPRAEFQVCGGQGGCVYVCSSQPGGNISITANGGDALQSADSLAQTLTRGTGGDGGVIRTGDINAFSCFADGGFHAAVISNVNGCLTTDSAKAASGTISASVISPYSKNPVATTNLEYFAAASLNDVVKINWVTASEENVDYFTVERSLEGNQFIPVFKINAKGNGGGKSTYHFEDASQTAADCQYRLTQTSQDGRMETFPAIRLKQPDKAVETKLLSIQPNPFSDQFTVQCTASEPGVLDISLTDISGNVIRRESAVAREGMNTITVNNLADLPKGTYFLSITSGAQKMSTLKIIK